MNVGSLFSGIGGIELGLERAGFESKWFVECDPFCQTILRKHWPQAQIYDDVTSVDFASLPKVDVLTGGFPCQDISNAGRKDGIEGSRSSLWKYYLKAIRTIRPRYAIIENVAALTIRGLDVVLADLAEIGYDAEWYNISASAVGAFHRRERIFIVVYPSDDGLSAPEIRGSTGQGINDGAGGEISPNQLARPSAEMEYADGERCKELDTAAQPGRTGQLGGRYDAGWGKWAAESAICRVADGIPDHMERIRALGNAVVPDCAEVFGRAIKWTN